MGRGLVERRVSNSGPKKGEAHKKRGAKQTEFSMQVPGSLLFGGVLTEAWERAVRGLSLSAAATGEAMRSVLRRSMLMTKLMHRLAPSAVSRRLLAPPAAPTHVPQAVHRFCAFDTAMPENVQMYVAWQNACSAAEAAVRAYPDDALLRRHREEVVAAYGAIFS